jgi:hypothetical protein
VGIVTPRPGVFLEAVKHLLVLCTTAEVWLGLRKEGYAVHDPLQNSHSFNLQKHEIVD